MQKFNLHTHTFRCGHASGTDDQMVLSAIEAGFEQLGFSDHMPYPELHLPTCRMAYDQRQEYVDSMIKLKVKYQDRIMLRFGYEAEYLEDHQKLLKQLHGEVDYLTKIGKIPQVPKRNRIDFAFISLLLPEGLLGGGDNRNLIHDA